MTHSAPTMHLTIAGVDENRRLLWQSPDGKVATAAQWAAQGKKDSKK